MIKNIFVNHSYCCGLSTLSIRFVLTNVVFVLIERERIWLYVHSDLSTFLNRVKVLRSRLVSRAALGHRLVWHGLFLGDWLRVQCCDFDISVGLDIRSDEFVKLSLLTYFSLHEGRLFDIDDG